MQISYTGDAFVTLTALVNYIEANNTQGAGLRWLNRFETFLFEKLAYPQHIPLCNNETFNQLLLHCINYNDWVIAFSLHNQEVLIEAILHTSRIFD